MGWMPKDCEPIQLNGAFHVSTTIMRFVVTSAAKAKLGALYHDFQTGIIFQLTLAKMGHPQTKKTPPIAIKPRLLALQTILSNGNV
jgi:hypothetical protein